VNAMRSKPGPPMTLANMRANGVRMVTASCANCGRQADINVDALPETLTVPKASQRLRCSACGGKQIWTRPAWHTAPRQGTPDLRPARL
jgi:DNA-directed RNA polymerase subunit RPC12/RpoP